ncbi:hypothetical protein B9Z19DRAFT_1120321 [Tuber borchii]|uniref:Uncharacterized protein n=1 Tax=Tuber borchii TaxID=42251 RepID=A0A2T7A4R5_TUBBO|nr:hypothetical protein B9Z19DRAFT_1120321 [Tuber borchii]
MESNIFYTILKAIQSGEPESLEFARLDPEESALVVESLFNPKNGLERYRFRVHLSSRPFAPDCHLRVVIPSFLHEAAAEWLLCQYGRWGVTGLINDVADEAMIVAPSARITNFTGNYVGSVKEPDLSFVPVSPNGLLRDFPSVILESGWASRGPDRVDECRLWHEGSGGRVRVVILVRLYRADAQNQVRVTLKISRTTPPGTVATVTRQNLFPIPALLPPDPTLTMEELFGGQCPPGLGPRTTFTLEVGSLRHIVETTLISDGYCPA